MKPLRLRDITGITGIPRETVRRKLAQLAEKRCVRKLPNGWVVSGARVEPELRDFTRESVIRFLSVAEELLTALRDADVRALKTSTQPSRT